MNEELLEKTRYEVVNYLTDSYMLNVIVDVIDNYKELLGEYKGLQQRIDKATEYILNKCPNSFLFRNEHIDKIFNILVGDNNE